MPHEMMTPRERIERLLRGEPADRVPFCPAVYEHKAALIGTTPSFLSRDAGLFEKALVREAELYSPDLLTVGCDVYNLEAEAAGCQVEFFDTPDVPAVRTRIVRPGDKISGLRMPDPERDGRMPVALEAGRRVREKLGADMIIRGALSAPFSIACEMAGAEPVLTALIDQPGWVSELVVWTARLAMSYGRAFVERGLGVVLFDSHAAPPMVSPRLFRNIIMPPTAEVIRYFREELAVPLVPYIIGGNTVPILDEILGTGTNNILCDFRADLEAFVGRLQGGPVLLRANLDPWFLLTQPEETIRAKAREVLDKGRRYPRFMLGTGIVPYDLPPSKILAVREAIINLHYS
jgi:uroporphyrinogen decarboxylase